MKNNSLKDTNADPVLRALTERMVMKGLSKTILAVFKNMLSLHQYLEQPGVWQKCTVHEVTGKLNSLMWSSVLITIIMLVIVAGITFLFANRIMALIKKLCVFANDIAQGDLKNANIHSKDEIGELAQSFKVMTKNLRSLMVM